MLHPTYLGYFDREAGEIDHEAVPRKPIDVEVFSAALLKVGTDVGSGMFLVGNDRFVLHQGYLRCLDVQRSRESVDLMADLARRTGCDIFYWTTGTFLTPDQLIKNFEEIELYRAKAREKARARHANRDG